MESERGLKPALSGFMRSGSDDVEVVETTEPRLAKVGTNDVIFEMSMLLVWNIGQ